MADAGTIPHVLLFPFPAQGHINGMFNLGELLSLAGLYVTFLNSDQIDRRLRRCTDLHAGLGSRKNIRFRTINCIPGMEGQLRPRDLPSFCQVKDLNNYRLNFFLSEFDRSSRAAGLIFNSFYDLEHNVLNQVSTQFANVYAVGPLHSLVRSQNLDHSITSGTSSLRKEDLSCIDWLGRWGKGCVLYVSFGSYNQINGDELLEFFHGLVNAGFPFLWVIRMDLVNGKLGLVPEELLEALQTRGCVVEWAPQEEVLAHPSVGGFLTHNGWNSTMESIFSGVPMLCWPFFADQPLNCRFVSHVWKIGLDMQGMCSRTMIERLVRELMAEKREELWESAARMKERAWKSIQDGGSSIYDFHKLVDDIRSMTAPNKIELSPFDNADWYVH